MSLAELISPAERVDGWCTGPELLALARIAVRAASTGPHLVEIGSWKGRSTIALGLALKRDHPNATLWCIDPHQGDVTRPVTETLNTGNPATYTEFLANVREHGLTDIVYPVVHRSTDVNWPGHRISFLFIDGEHTYDAALADFGHFAPYLSSGSFVCFHDFDDNFPGVQRAVTELVENRSVLPHSIVDTLYVSVVP